MRKRLFRWTLLTLAVFLVLLAGILPAADVPVKVYENAVLCIPLFAVPAAACAWGYLALSPRRRRDFLLAFGLNLLAVYVLCRAILDILECYSYYVTG